MSFRRSAVLAALVTGAVAFAPAAAQADSKTSTKCSKSKKSSKKCPPAVKTGRMTGHGHQFNYGGFDKVQWEFRNSVCNEKRFPDLKVEFGGHRFILTDYNNPGLICFTLNPPKSTEENPYAGFDSIRATGTGTLDGKSGYGITFRFTDAGEPGRKDTAVFTITSPTGAPVLQFDYTGGAYDGGNHQAHRR